MMTALLLLLSLAASAEDGCLARFAPERLAADMKAGKYTPKQLETIAGIGGVEALKYFSFKAFAERDPAVCEALRPLRGELHDEEKLCVTTYLELVYVDALVKGRRAERDRACADDVLFHEGGDRKAAEKTCAFRGKRLDSLGQRPSVAAIKAGCADVTKGADEKQKAKCTPYSRAFFGDDGGCSRAGAFVADPGEAKSDVLQCRSFAAFQRAHKGKSVKRCRGLELCRVLMGEGAPVRRERGRRLAAVLCAAGL